MVNTITAVLVAQEQDTKVTLKAVDTSLPGKKYQTFEVFVEDTCVGYIGKSTDLFCKAPRYPHVRDFKTQDAAEQFLVDLHRVTEPYPKSFRQFYRLVHQYGVCSQE
jgi:hypothetical protein